MSFARGSATSSMNGRPSPLLPLDPSDLAVRRALAANSDASCPARLIRDAGPRREPQVRRVAVALGRTV